MAGVHNDIALITAVIIACDSYEEDEPPAKRSEEVCLCGSDRG